MARPRKLSDAERAAKREALYRKYYARVKELRKVRYGLAFLFQLDGLSEEDRQLAVDVEHWHEAGCALFGLPVSPLPPLPADRAKAHKRLASFRWHLSGSGTP